MGFKRLDSETSQSLLDSSVGFLFLWKHWVLETVVAADCLSGEFKEEKTSNIMASLGGGKAPPAEASKKGLSSKLLQLKFMQRSADKQQAKFAAEAEASQVVFDTRGGSQLQTQGCNSDCAARACFRHAVL